MNVQKDHVHLIIGIPPKVSVSEMVGMLKGRTAIRVFNKFKRLKERPYWGNHFWAKGFCVDTIGLDMEMIKKYVWHQKSQEKILFNLGTTRYFAFLKSKGKLSPSKGYHKSLSSGWESFIPDYPEQF